MTDAEDPPAAGSADAVAVFVHVHFPDVWEDMARLLSDRMTVPFKLVVTSSLAREELATPETPWLHETIFIACENRGRDIRPFLIALGAVEGYSIGLKLHTKRSTHRLDGGGWRDVILDSLLPAGGGTREIVSRLRRDSRIGLVAPEGMFVPINDWIGFNRPKMEAALEMLSLPSRRQSYVRRSFAAGSMFWFRREALLGFAGPLLPDAARADLLDCFEAEAGQLDGTMAHALERLFAIVVEERRFVALSAGALAATEPSMSRGQLDEALRLHVQPSLPFLIPPPTILRLADLHLPFLTPIYRRLPTGVRHMVRDGLLAVFGDRSWRRKGSRARPGIGETEN